MKRSEENLKAVVALLAEMKARGKWEQGHTEALARSITELCRVRRTHDSAKVWAAVDRVAKMFLRTWKR